MIRTSEVTRLLLQAEEQGRELFDRLLPLVYDDLRWMARRQLRGERGARVLDTTALVHEAYLKLVSHSDLPLRSRAYFFGAAARAMRQILVDCARRRKSGKRSGGERVDLEAVQIQIEQCADELISLDGALDRLEKLDEVLVRVVECRFFAGLSVEETAEALDISPRTVKRHWRKARAWLYRALYGAVDDSAGPFYTETTQEEA
jgi:RNA polymerase sigma-70 factor, ECF subfamily